MKYIFFSILFSIKLNAQVTPVCPSCISLENLNREESSKLKEEYDDLMKKEKILIGKIKIICGFSSAEIKDLAELYNFLMLVKEKSHDEKKCTDNKKSINKCLKDKSIKRLIEEIIQNRYILGYLNYKFQVDQSTAEQIINNLNEFIK